MFCTVLYDGQGLIFGGESIEVNSMCSNMLQSNNLALHSSNYMSIHALLHSISIRDFTKLGEGKFGVWETKGEEQS